MSSYNTYLNQYDLKTKNLEHKRVALEALTALDEELEVDKLVKRRDCN